MLLKFPSRGMLCNNGLLVYLSCMVYGATKNNPMKEQDINKDHLLPVHMVSVDQYILRDPSRLYHKKGKSDTSVMYSKGFF